LPLFVLLFDFGFGLGFEFGLAAQILQEDDKRRQVQYRDVVRHGCKETGVILEGTG
jgi:hypothetical protein